MKVIGINRLSRTAGADPRSVATVGDQRWSAGASRTVVSRTEPVLAMIGRLFGKTASQEQEPPPPLRQARSARRAPLTPQTPMRLPELRRYVAISEPVEPGDVLVLDRVQRGQIRPGDTLGDTAVIGVVSADPGRIKERAAVTVSGVVLCKVDAGFGAIHEGDSLIVSSTRGHAMPWSGQAPAAILGRALQPLDSGLGLIKVLVTLR